MGASASTSLAGKHVVVVGGSFGAKSAVAECEKRGARVTLVAPSDRLYVVFGGVRAAAHAARDGQSTASAYDESVDLSMG